MADEPEIPQDLIDAQRRFTEANAAAVEAAGPRTDGQGNARAWTAEDQAVLERLRGERMVVLNALLDLREGSPFAPWPAQQRLRDAASAAG